MPITRAGLEALICRRLDEGCGGWVITANLEIARQCVADPAIEELVDSADVVVADGAPLVWASRLARRPVPERVAGSDLIWSLTDRAASHGRSIYLLGGSVASAERAATELTRRCSGLQVAGWDCPPFGFERSATGLESIERRLTALAPDIVYVGLGFPKQERLIAHLRSALPQTWFIGVGVSIDFVAGRVRRAPIWIQKLGFEWLYRMYQEPRKLVVRYLVNGLPFAARLLGWALVTRVGR